MSWWVYIAIDTGNEDGPAEVEEVGNVTYNVSPMYYRAFGATGSDEGLRGLNRMSCSGAEPVLAAAIRYMEDNSDALRNMNPENGWGDFDGALKFLHNLLRAVKRHPLAFVRIS